MVCLYAKHILMEYHTKSGKKNPSPILTKKHLVQTDIFSNMIKYMIMNDSMEKKLNDKVVIPEKYKKMTQDELHAEIRRKGVIVCANYLMTGQKILRNSA